MKKIAPFLLVIICIISACKKDPAIIDCPECTNPAISGKVKTVRIKNTGVVEPTENYKYDSIGRLRCVLTDAGDTLSDYNYQEGKVYYMWRLSVSQAMHYTILYLNKDGLDSSNRKRYNADGFLIYAIVAYGGISAYYDYVDENLTTSTLCSDECRGGAAISVDYYTYLTDKIDNRDYGKKFEGRHSKNLCNSEYQYSGEESIYSYEFDSQNRVIKETLNFYSGGYIVKEFTYY